MSDSQGDTSGTSTSNCSGTHSSEPGTSSQPSKMVVEQKLSSSSREMRNMAEKMRRDKLNSYVAKIADIVPLGSGATKRVDKTSVLRLAANYIRMHKIMKDDDDDTASAVPQTLGREITHSLAEAVGGFLLVVTSSGKVVYITEAVDQFFGHTQVDLLGHSIYNVIHPDDHDIFQQQLVPKENSRRSFFCRMMEKALSRNDPGRYEIIHVVGQLKPLPQIQHSHYSGSSPLAPSPDAPSPYVPSISSDQEDESSDNEGDMQMLKVTNKTGTHMLVSFVRVVKDRPITELSLVESTQDEYITRHGMDGKILYTDHRISFVTGLMPSEVVGTSAFYYMHEEDIVWSVVAQNLMFTSTQGQGIVSYRLKCKDGAHVTLRSRGFLEVNKQTGQVESFVCINTVLSMKEASSEIKNQRRKLLPIIACHETEDHLGSISSSLPPELMMMLKQMMTPQTMQKMIKSVETSEAYVKASNSGSTKSLSIDRVTSPSPENIRDMTKSTNHSPSGHPFQTKPKRHCSESIPESFVRSVSVNKECGNRTLKKRSGASDYSEIANKKLNFERDLPCPELLHADYATNTCSQQSSPRTSPQPHLSPSTSSVPENTISYPSGTCQQYSNNSSSISSIHNSGSSSYSGDSTDGNTIHPNNSHQYQNISAVSPSTYWQHRTIGFPPTPDICIQSASSPEKCDQRLSQSLSPTCYNQRIPAHVPVSPGYNQSKRDSSLSPGLCDVRIANSVSPLDIQSSSPNNHTQNRLESLPVSSNAIGSCNEGASHGIPPVSYSQTSSQGLSSGSYKYSGREANQLPQTSDQNVCRNISMCSYQYNVVSPKDQSTLSHNQLLSQYHQTSGCTSLTINQQQYHHPGPPQEHCFAASHQTSTRSSPGHYSEYSPNLHKPHSSHTKQLPDELESSHLAVPITSSHNLSFSETGTSGKLL